MQGATCEIQLLLYGKISLFSSLRHLLISVTWSYPSRVALVKSNKETLN